MLIWLAASEAAFPALVVSFLIALGIKAFDVSVRPACPGCGAKPKGMSGFSHCPSCGRALPWGSPR